MGIVIMMILIATRSAPTKEERRDPGVLVQLLKAEKVNKKIKVKGTGTVDATMEITVVPQVSGRVTRLSPNLVEGGFFKKGETLFEIDDTDYILALERALAAKAKAEYELAEVEGQANIARTEWELIKSEEDAAPDPLLLYEPQLKNARASLASAMATVRQAEVDLERTKVSAAFNGRIRSENIDIGQFVMKGSAVAVLSGTDRAEIRVPLTLDEIQWLSVPRQGEGQKGSKAVVQMEAGNEVFNWHGEVVRSTEEVDAKSRMVEVVVEIDDPYGLKKGNTPALMTGSFVTVIFEGKTLNDVFIIPRKAFHDNSTVWVMDKENKLLIKKVVPVKIEKTEVIINEGLAEGDMVVLTNITGAANGMKLRPVKHRNE
jgi:RND family efflux transporter MFP subunit